MRRMKWCVLALALNAAGCATNIKYISASGPIDIDTSPGGPRYLQNGEGIDTGFLTDQLQKEPESASNASTARALRIASVLLAGAGGAMVGWPLGQALGNELAKSSGGRRGDEPLWPLAGAGAAAIGLSIPLAVLGIFAMDNAVKDHNRVLGSGTARPITPPRVALGPRRDPIALPGLRTTQKPRGGAGMTSSLSQTPSSVSLNTIDWRDPGR